MTFLICNYLNLVKMSVFLSKSLSIQKSDKKTIHTTYKIETQNLV